MRWLQAVAALALLLAVAAPAVAAEPRQPTARWVVNFDATQCVASRNYGTDDDPLFLVLKSPPLGNVIQIGILRAGKAERPTQVDVEVAFDQRPPLRTSMLVFTARKQNRRAHMINLPIQEFVPASTAKILSIRATGNVDERFAISAMAPLMRVMEDCVADLRNVWNLTEMGAPAPHLTQPPRGNLQNVLKSRDYPGVAMDKDQSGTATLALLIDEAGKVADCTVIGTSGAASLDAQSCFLLKERARFKPAIGLDGRPSKGSFLQRISWRIES